MAEYVAYAIFVVVALYMVNKLTKGALWDWIKSKWSD